MTLIYKDVEGSIFRNPADALLAFFIMSLGEFGDFYESFDDAHYQFMAIVGYPQLQNDINQSQTLL